jgi:glycyl-tRNA synthetase beta chain
MRWGSHELRYARPIRWLIALYGDQLVNFEVTGVHTGRISQGHRFLGQPVEITEPKRYLADLRSQKVLADMTERRSEIVSQIEALATRNDWHVPLDPQLLDEVTSLSSTRPFSTVRSVRNFCIFRRKY